MRRNIIFIYIVYLSKRFIFVSAFFVLFLLVCLSVCLSSPDLLVSVFTTACREIFPFLSVYQGNIGGRENFLLIGCCQIWRQNINQNWLSAYFRLLVEWRLRFFFLSIFSQNTCNAHVVIIFRSLTYFSVTNMTLIYIWMLAHGNAQEPCVLAVRIRQKSPQIRRTTPAKPEAVSLNPLGA